MKKIIYKSKAIQAVIIIIAACFLLSLFPLRLWQERVTFSIPGETGALTGPIDDTRMLVQGFTAQYDHMGSIRIFLGDGTTGETFLLSMLNEAGGELFEQKVAIDPRNLPGYYEILVDQELEVGSLYFFVLQGTTPSGRVGIGEVSQLYAGSEWIPMTDYPYAGVMYYMDSTMEGSNLAADYHYTVPLRKGKMALFGGGILLAAALLICLVRHYYKIGREKDTRDRLITVEQAFKAVCNPLAVIGTLAGLAGVLLGVFGSQPLDNGFFFISILLLGAILLYGINHNRDGQAPLINKELLKSKWPDYLQSVLIAGALAACCEYMSGLYDIHHTIAEYKEVIFFSLAVAVMIGRRELFRIHNLIYVAVAGGYGYYYYTSRFTQELPELDGEALKLSVWAGAFAGFVILNVLISVTKKMLAKEYKQPVFLYGGLIAFFFLLIIVFRNGRWWTVSLAAAFTLFYLQYGAWRKWDILTNILRGIILQFIWATGYALLHRPFVTFRTARYPHIFHTVTITATWLTIVEGAAMVLLLSRFRKSHKLKDIWKECVLFGVVTSYVLFTMARTGFLSVAVTAVLAVVIMTVGRGMEKIRNIVMAAGVMILSAVICFPVTFFAQRTVPALVSEPVLYEIESYPDEVMRGQKIDSVEFMRIGRFIDIFADKIFGIPEGTLDIYGEIEEYNETHIYVDDQVLKVDRAETMGIETGQIDTVAEIKEAEAQEGGDAEAIMDPDFDYTNGRTDIFRSYIQQLNLFGHQEMGALLQDGSIATHAHNIYLQFAYDHGILPGILFILIVLITLIRSGVYCLRNIERDPYAALPIVMIGAVAVEGIAEWVFHFSNPSGLIFMLVITPLLFRADRAPSGKA